jgi:hypothetical protein
MFYVSSHQQYLVYSSWDLLKPLYLDGLNDVQITQDKVTESVINSKNSGHIS